ncbi:hypothetical protein CDL15_Pgr003881 [Punica granatum]|uniref:Uncharacterized protein n=1 Tax=Punica granatum TaxID=22663 RepID=A0A218XV50_PUNGR|nr:hypothetical protein CDL15_Pgr003881 [Punica granatum]PKI73838.1 hypothetical protein CRG98_005708 [Punica granatum]
MDLRRLDHVFDAIPSSQDSDGAWSHLAHVNLALIGNGQTDSNGMSMAPPIISFFVVFVQENKKPCENCHRDHPSSAPPPSTARGKDDTNSQASLSSDLDAAFLPYRSDNFLHFEMRHCLSSSPLSTAPLGTSVEHLHFNFLY